VNNAGVGGVETYDLTSSSSGPYYVLIYSLSGSDSVQVELLDIGPPTISITSPQDNYNSSSTTVTIQWSSSDIETSITEHEIWIDGSLQYDNIPGTTTQYDIDLTEGTHIVEVKAYDEGGNSASDSITITVDTTAPTVAISSPSDGETLTTSDVTVSWSGDDGSGTGIEHYEVRCYNSTWDSGWINVGKDTSYTFTNLADGSYTVIVEAYDYAGNIGSDNVSFTINTVANVTIESPAEDPDTGEAYIGGDSVALSWSDSGDADHYEIYVNGSYDGSTTGTNYIVSGLSEGVWNITVVSIYASGGTSSDYIIVVVDLTLPTISPSKTTMTANSETTSVTISWSGDDALSGIDHYEIYVGGSWIYLGNSTSYTIDTSAMSDGLYAVYIRAFDKAGWHTQSTIMLIVDKTAPLLSIDYPADGSIFSSGTVTVVWSASDNLIDIAYYEVSSDGTNWINVGRETSYQFSLSDGTYTIYVRAYDESGNYVEATVTITIDTTAPDVTITSPSDGDIITSSSVTVEWTSSATDISYYLVRLDSGLWINVGTSTNYTFTNVGDGIHVVYVMAVDNAGLSTVAHVVFSVSTAGKASNTPLDNSKELVNSISNTATSSEQSDNPAKYVKKVGVITEGEYTGKQRDESRISTPNTIVKADKALREDISIEPMTGFGGEKALIATWRERLFLIYPIILPMVHVKRYR